MNITLNITEKIYNDALRYVLNLEAYLENAAHSAADCARAENPGVDLATLPTLAEREATRLQEQKLAMQATEAVRAQEQAEQAAEQAQKTAAADAQHKAAVKAQAMEMLQELLDGGAVLVKPTALATLATPTTDVVATVNTAPAKA